MTGLPAEDHKMLYTLSFFKNLIMLFRKVGLTGILAAMGERSFIIRLYNLLLCRSRYFLGVESSVINSR